jgi:hypothetical protein
MTPNPKHPSLLEEFNVTDFNKYKPCVVNERRDGSVYISFGNPRVGAHYQCDFGDDLAIAEAVATAFNAYEFQAQSEGEAA